ncbi:ComF family protein [Arcanobacterium bovis]|uniref:Phosphoribosyltransferase domain-containing protein n=1 Tax=Arcanobacterium bovis TaxID=2529275 RepID=A0A4Q9V3D9_9ACTO|nr:phosphoribosyltransferase family protein [Arcanobacterium bovis]TBW23613.1 hypothetical protein EZJ44_00265 [Arcanobacterium bovis]
MGTKIFDDFVDALLNMVYPQFCAGCGRWDTPLCACCVSDMTAQWKRADASTPFLQYVDPAGGPDISAFPIYSSLTYQGVVAQAVVAWKNTQSAGLTRAMRAVWQANLATICCGKTMESLFPGHKSGRAVAVVPLPSRWRRKHDGRMIVLDLAQIVGEVFAVPCIEVLKKRRSRGVFTLAEAGWKPALGAELKMRLGTALAKIGQLGGGYAVETFTGRAKKRNSICATRDLRGWDVILVDDVVTTGATFDAAFRAVRNAGGRVIGGFSFAMAPDPRISPVA